MGSAIPNPINLRRAVIAVLALVAILVAPVCSPLCAAKVCSSGVPQEEECHSQTAMGDTANDRYEAPMKPCAARELTAALLRANKRLVQATQLQDLSVEWELGGRVAEPSAILGAPVLRWGEDRFALGPGLTSSLLQSTHLRF